MKLHASCFLSLVALACSVQSVRSQNSNTLGIATYAGLTITAAEAGFRDIEATADPSQSGGWALLESTLYVKGGEPTLWFDASTTGAGKRFYRVVEPPVKPLTNMVAISPGTFVMGSTILPNEGPLTSVTISRGFYMGKYEVTQAEYLAVTENNPSTFTGLTRPVNDVTWSDAVGYCAMLTSLERARGRCPADWSYRLPTEAEWEYACRAGTTTKFSYGDDLGYTLFTNYAWYAENSGDTTHPVGQKAPNPWGLYDMHGNVQEWCQDLWDGIANYPGGSTNDPLLMTGSIPMLRGGSWSPYAFDYGSTAAVPNTPTHARSAYRFYAHEWPFTGFYMPGVGLRVVLAPVQ